MAGKNNSLVDAAKVLSALKAKTLIGGATFRQLNRVQRMLLASAETSEIEEALTGWFDSIEVVDADHEVFKAVNTLAETSGNKLMTDEQISKHVVVVAWGRTILAESDGLADFKGAADSRSNISTQGLLKKLGYKDGGAAKFPMLVPPQSKGLTVGGGRSRRISTAKPAPQKVNPIAVARALINAGMDPMQALEIAESPIDNPIALAKKLIESEIDPMQALEIAQQLAA